MITIPRSLVRQLRTVFRHALQLTSREAGPNILLAAGPDGLRIRTQNVHAAIEHHAPGDLPAEQMWLPWEFLDTCEGKKDEPVTLQRQGEQIAAEWLEGSVPQVARFDVQETPDNEFPSVPEQMVANSADLLRALDDCHHVTDPDCARYALGCIQLDGTRGRIAACDGRQLLVHGGFSFPWEGEILLPARKLFACPCLSRSEPVRVGSDENWLALQTGPWMFYLRLYVDGRFPRVDDCIPGDAAVTATLDISEADAQFLAANLKHLPSHDEVYHPVTVDLNGQVTIRAKAADREQVTELVLSNSARSGEALCLNTDRQYVARALDLGFRRIAFTKPEGASFCREERRMYLWMALEDGHSIPSSKDATRIESPRGAVTATAPKAKPERSKPATMSDSQTNVNGKSARSRAGNGSVSADKTADADTDGQTGSPIQQAEAVRDSLKDALGKTNELIRTLKRQRRHSRVVESTLASLRQLQDVNL